MAGSQVLPAAVQPHHHVSEAVKECILNNTLFDGRAQGLMESAGALLLRMRMRMRSRSRSRSRSRNRIRKRKRMRRKMRVRAWVRVRVRVR